MKIGLNTGRGLTFNGNKLTSNLVESSLLIKKSDGIYIPSLVGKDGGNGGSIVDGITVKGTADKIEGLNYENVMNIFSISAFKLSGHVSNDGVTLPLVGNTSSSHVKQINDIVAEMNFDSGNGVCYQTQYHALNNDLLLLKDIAIKGVTCRAPGKGGQCMEDGNRYLQSVPYALFTIDDIVYSMANVGNTTDWTCRKLTLLCVWVTNAETLSGSAVRSVYTPGQSYSYN